MVVDNICYHMPCMHSFKATNQPLYDIAFDQLVGKLKTTLFHDKSNSFVIFGDR